MKPHLKLQLDDDVCIDNSSWPGSSQCARSWQNDRQDCWLRIDSSSWLLQATQWRLYHISVFVIITISSSSSSSSSSSNTCIIGAFLRKNIRWSNSPSQNRDTEDAEAGNTFWHILKATERSFLNVCRCFKFVKQCFMARWGKAEVWGQ